MGSHRPGSDRPSFPFILPFWVFICLIFGFWAFISFILAFWAFISFHCGLLGLHSLYFCLLVASFWGPTHKLPKTVRFPKVPHKEFNSARPSSIFRFLAFGASFPFILALWAFIPCSLALWAFIFFYFGLLGLHFLSFWPCGPSFPFILAFSGSASGPPPTSCQKWPVCPTSLQWIYQRRDRLHFAVFGLVGLHFLAFWPCGPSFRCILALWAFISLHFGFVGLHFLAFWPCGPSFPCILALWAFISIHFGLFGVSFWPPPHKLPKMARLPNVLTMDLSAPWPAPFCSFWPCGPSFPFFGLLGFHFLSLWPFGPSFPLFLPFGG